MPAEEEPSTLAKMLAQVFRDSPLPIAVYDREGDVRHANDAHDAFASALGDVTGVGDFNALTDLRSERGGHRQQFLRALDGVSTDYGFEAPGQHGIEGGEPLEFRRVLIPARDDTGQILGVVGVVVDVSDWLRAERDRTRLQAQLMRAQKAESLGLLAGSIAHDFNNLLMGVLGNVSLLLAKLTPGSDLRRLAEAVQLSARRAAEVARQLLAYAGKGQFRVETVDLSELVRDTAEVLRISVADQGGVALELRDGLHRVRVDPTQLRQVVMNLVTNARDAIADGGGTITVRTGQVAAAEAELDRCQGSPDPEAKAFVFVEVQDTGVGMDARTLERIFDPFYTTKPSGHGLGLSAVLGIVRSHGGALRVESTPGRGTWMRVLLPARSHPARPSLRSVPAPSPERTERGGRGGQVLVVDDQETIRRILAEMLGTLGYRAASAASGAEALHALSSEAEGACCVLLDLTMPGEDGGDVLARIRQRHPGTKVILMSGYEEDSVPRADAFLHKPFTMDELRKALERALG